MKLSLSVRVAETFSSKEHTAIPFAEILALARRHGFDALCMRASAAGIHTPAETIDAMRRSIESAGLSVSMVTGDFAVPANNERGPDGLRNITPYLDLAERFGAPLIRVCMKGEEDIPWARKSADEARERGIRLAHQSHTTSLFETVDGAWQTLQAIGKPNFGLIYEAANWFMVGQPYGREVIRRFEPYLFNVYVQNLMVRPDGESSLQTFTRGVIRLHHIGIWEQGGVDYDEALSALRDMRYEGCVTVHQAFAGIMPVEDAVGRSAEFLKRYCRQ